MTFAKTDHMLLDELKERLEGEWIKALVDRPFEDACGPVSTIRTDAYAKIEKVVSCNGQVLAMIGCWQGNLPLAPHYLIGVDEISEDDESSGCFILTDPPKDYNPAPPQPPP